MALPAQRINRLTNPAPASTTGFASSGGAGTWTYNTSEADPFVRFTKDATVATTALYWGNAVTAASGTTVSFRFWIRASAAATITLRNNGTAFTTDATRALTANTWTEVTYNAYVTTVADFRLAFVVTSMGANTTWDLKKGIVEFDSTSPSFFTGATVETGWTHAWTGTANASTSTRDVYGIWPEQSTDAGAPKVQLTAIGLGGTSVTTKVVRESDGETWTVPGWKRRNTLGGHTMPDHSAPLGRPVTYTLYVNNSAVSSRTITVTSTRGWVQSPVQPELAMPIALDASDPNQLSLAKPSLKEVTYESRGDEEYPMGGSYPIARAATRGAAGGLTLVLNARTDAVSDSFLDIMKASPILLFRPLPTWGSTPALSYLRGNVVETPLTRDVGQGFTRWTAEGRLVAPVATAPLTGSVTNQMVANNLVGRTNSSVAAASANKRNIDIAANPLGLGV